MSEKKIVSRIYKELLQFNNKSNNNLKWAKDFNSYFTKKVFKLLIRVQKYTSTQGLVCNSL